MSNHPFQSFIMGGFECSTHTDRSGRRLDLIDATRHEEFAYADYNRAVGLGLRTVRDGLRWHLIENAPFRYDFSSVDHQIAAANRTGIEVIWDYFHYGYPADIDIFQPQFIERFASFAYAATEYLKSNYAGAIHVCPVNEISFFSWIAGNRGQFFPCVRRRDNELKDQLVKASRAAVLRIREVAPTATIMFTEPAIHVVPRDSSPRSKRAAEAYRQAQFQALDKLEGVASEIGNVNDLIGLNYYFHNQWRHPSRRKISLGHPDYRPLRDILAEYHERYRKPILIAETGIEDDERPVWFRYVCDEIAAAMLKGVPVVGICLYPIVNHPGWADDRHCYNGLWDYADNNGHRDVYLPLAAEIGRQIVRFDEIFKDHNFKAFAAA